MAASIIHAQQALIADFQSLSEWMDRYEYIIELGRQLRGYPEAWQIEDYRIHGCQAQVWFHPEVDDGVIHFAATSDAAIVKGLIAILLKVYSGRRPEEILAAPPEFITAIGLDKHLSPTRSNGLHHILAFIFNFAKNIKESA